MKTSTVLKTSLLTCGISYGVYKILAKNAIDTAFLKKEKENPESYLSGEELAKKIVEIDENNEWISRSKSEDVWIESLDGLKLHGRLIQNNNSNLYIICVHGWHGNGESMYTCAKGFDGLGYNMLVIDQRASGLSQGNYYSFGLKESMDVIQWIQFLNKKMKNIEIILYGISMGAATVMMTCNFALPDNVKGIVEDCGYCSYEKQIEHYFKSSYHLLNVKPLVTLFEIEMRNRFGYCFYDISPMNALKDNSLPLLIIHGEDDDFVPFEMSKYIYGATKGIRKYWSIPNLKHNECKSNDHYFINIDNFIKEILS